MKLRLALAIGGALVLSTLPATAADGELFTARRAGPIRNGKTTIAKVKKWFGEPDVAKEVERGCFTVHVARWTPFLKVYAVEHPQGGRRITESWVRRRTITSEEHGDLTMATPKGLRVGDKVRRLKKLYPDHQRFRLGGENFYELKPVDEFAPRLWAMGRNKRVRALINRPYEYC